MSFIEQPTPPRVREPLNGFRHPYTGLTTVMSDEDADEQIYFMRDIIGELDPQGPIQRHYARTFALDNWRLTRIKTVEENLLAYGQLVQKHFTAEIQRVETAIGHAWTFSMHNRVFDQISKYESRLLRNIERVRDLLRKEKAERPQSQAKPEAQSAAEPLTRTAAASSDDRKEPVQ